jgi:hypothetical protein
MTKASEHGELRKRPWEREESYRVPTSRMGRPDLPQVEGEIEALLRIIGTLPDRVPWWPGGENMNVFEVAYEVRTLLEPRILTVTLGNGDAYADYWLWGPGSAELRCAKLCLPHPTEERWAVVEDRSLLFEGERARTSLSRCVKRSAQLAIQELNRHWIPSPELSQTP